MEAYDTLDSTNLRAKAWARENAAHGDWVIADCQSAGRGRLGRTFESPENAGLYMTVILFPEEEMLPLLTVAAAVSALEAIESLAGVKPGIKWVNDLILDGKKICGILAEGVVSPEGKRGAVVGIGVNLKKEALPKSLAEIAGALEGGIEKDALAVTVRKKLIQWTQPDRRHELIEKYRENSILTGKKIEYCEAGVWKSAVVEDVGEMGELIVLDEKGERHALFAGEVTMHRAQRQRL